MSLVDRTLKELEKKISVRMHSYVPLPVEYANFWSKLFFAKSFEDQFAVPLPQPRWIEKTLELLETRITPKDLDTIPIDRPIFVIGLPRSGTTLLHYLLSYQGETSGFTNIMNSFPNAPIAISRIQKLLNLNIRGDRHLKDSVPVDFTSPSEPIMFWQNWTKQDVYDLTYRPMTRASVGEDVIQRMHRDVRKALSIGGKSRFVCKYPYFSTQIPFLAEAFPDAHFIHIIRNPLEVAHSMVKLYQLIEHQRLLVNHPTMKTIIPYPRTPSLKDLIEREGPESLVTTSTVWKETVEGLDRDRHRVAHYCEVRYEDLLAEPAKTTARIFEFAGLKTPSSSNTRYMEEFQNIGKIRHKTEYPVSPVIASLTSDAARAHGYS